MVVDVVPQDVLCPRCQARPGEPCTTAKQSKPVATAHKARRDLAGELAELLPPDEPVSGPEVIDFDRHPDGRLTDEGREQLARWSLERGLPTPRDTSMDVSCTVANAPGGLPYSGRRFTVRLVSPGEYRADSDMVWPSDAREQERADAGDRLVEVYDAEYGAYITCYYASTLLARAHRGALDLNPEVAVWTLDATAMAEVVAFIRPDSQPAEAAPPPVFELPTVRDHVCPGCGGAKLSWHIRKQVNGIDGRLCLADVSIVVMLECDHCSRCVVTQSV